jgi:hypothetical protein
MKSYATVALATLSSFALTASAAPVSEVTSAQMKHANAQYKKFAAIARQSSADNGFAAFKASVYKEPFPGGVYIVNGDTPIGNDKDLLDFYRKEIVHDKETANYGVKLIIDAPSGKIAGWDSGTKNNLTYCVSKTFGNRYQTVVDAMAVATKAWEEASNVSYKHLATLDEVCNETISGVIFDVRPVNVSGEYLARAFFPRQPREERSVLIDESSFDLNPDGKLQLAGILRHELGHTLGFRHEQTRPEAGKCFEDKDWVPLTSYDAFSVMHYPQCNGLSDWSLMLTKKDKLGAACHYGGAKGAPFDEAKCISSNI